MNKIKFLREKIHMTQTKLGNILNVTQKTISAWETGKNDPDIETLKKLATIFNCSVDKLIDYDANQQKKLETIEFKKEDNLTSEQNMFGDNLKKIRKQNKMGQVELAKKLKVANGTISMWENNLRTPDLATIKEISSIFKMPISYLIEDEIKKEPETIEFKKEDNLTSEQKQCIDILKTMTPKQVERTFYFMLGITEQDLEIKKKE